MHTPPPLAASSPESADSILALSKQDGAPHGKSRSTPSTGLCLLTDFPMPDSLRTCVNAESEIFRAWIASRQDSPARTSATQEARAKAGTAGLMVRGAGSSLKSYASSMKYGPNGLCLKTSRRCSLRGISKTFKSWSGASPRAVIWDARACWMLTSSASPKDVRGFTWWAVLEPSPPLSCWLMPHQWSGYLARLLRAESYGAKRIAGLATLYLPKMCPPASPLAVSFSLLTRTDGVRWLSGSESLSYMGFASDWMRPTLRRLSLRETPSVRKLPNGSPAKSSAQSTAN